MIRPSDFELKLMRHLWRHKALSARELHNASVDETRWSYSATRKTLERMTEKGLVQIRSVHGLNVYSADQSKLETLATLVSAFTRDVLDLQAPLPVAAFANSPLIEPDEIDKLERLLEQLAAPKPVEDDGEKSQ